MLSSVILFVTIYFVSYVNCNDCFLRRPNFGSYYIEYVHLLDAITYPDSVLLKISKVILPGTPRNEAGPKCKIMNINDGSVGQPVNCDDYSGSIRAYGVADTDPTNTNVKCDVNCDGSTATSCNITRNDNLYPFNVNINCNNNEFASFTINDISTTYIRFEENMFGLVFNNDDSSAVTTPFEIINVDQKGNKIGTNINPMIYSSSNIIENEIPCCHTCFRYTLFTYNIEVDTDTTNNYDQIFTYESFEHGGGLIDTVKSRVYQWKRSYSNYINVYKSSDGQLIQYQPDLIF